MRLLGTAPSAIPQTREFFGSQVPPYAILSHTWGDDEVMLQQLRDGNQAELQRKTGFRKILQTCALARERDKLQYVWVDTCCIDKTSSTELSEAINSMFAWYRDAQVCYVHLVDLPPGTADDLKTRLPSCRWFTRGWTLQELLAPRQVLFFDSEWNYRGELAELAGLVSAITGIPEQLLRHETELSDYAVARRMSWAAKRETTRVEDRAYCLFGIFDINMPLIYGEGPKAFTRLQEAILRATADPSIFAWQADSLSDGPTYTGILADSPRLFAWCTEIEPAKGDLTYTNCTITARGIHADAPVFSKRDTSPELQRAVFLDTCCRIKGGVVGVRIRKFGGNLYARCQPDKIFIMDEEYFTPRLASSGTITLATKLPARFPFSAGPDPVVGNRYSALRINNNHNLGLTFHAPYPDSNWDPEQRVFFACNDHIRGWCVDFISGQLAIGDSTSSVRNFLVKIIVGCFEWNTGTPLIVLANPEDIDMAMFNLLAAQLRRFKFESHERPMAILQQVFEHHLTKAMPVQTAFGTVFLRVRPTDKWSEAEPELRLKFSVQKLPDPKVCTNPTTVIDICWEHPQLLSSTPGIGEREAQSRSSVSELPVPLYSFQAPPQYSQPIRAAP
ncbi:hypothetical protein VTH82DRAFT_1632 [Thermothelomyces myriococcoides]